MDNANLVAQLIEQSRTLELAGDIGAAYKQAQQAWTEAQTAGDREAITAAQMCLAAVHFRLGHTDEARRLAGETLTQASPDDPAKADAFLMMGICADWPDYIASRETYYHQAIDLSRQLGYHRVLLRGLHNLSSGVYMPRGQFDLALAADAEALQLVYKYGMPEYAWGPLVTISWIYEMTGRWQEAETSLDQLIQVSPPGSLAEGYYYCTRANLALDGGFFEQALTLFAQARTVAEAIGSPDLNIFVRLGLSRCHRQQGDFSTARAWAEDALALAKRVDYPYLEGLALIEHARATWPESDKTLPGKPASSVVENDLRSASTIFNSLNDHFDLARVYMFLGALFITQKRPTAVDTWVEASRRILEGGYIFLVYQERNLAYPFISAYLNSKQREAAEVSHALLEHLQRVPAEPLRVIALGGFQVWQGARQVALLLLRKRRAGELLALLLITPRQTLTYEQACEALCPDLDLDSALDVLHHATSSLRRVLEPELPDRRFPSRYLQVDNGQITLLLPRGSWLDLEVFQEHIHNCRWEDAITLYAGELFPEYRYSDWAADLRESLSSDYQSSLIALARARLGASLWDAALDNVRCLLALDPWNEQAALIGMQAYVAMNQPAEALRLYRQLEQSLSTELGIDPQEELQRLKQAILSW